MELPTALFLCGTEDFLLEDTIMMATRWQMAGAEAETRSFPGGAAWVCCVSAGSGGVCEGGDGNY